jgi:cytoskeletal protein RodZ
MNAVITQNIDLTKQSQDVFNTSIIQIGNLLAKARNEKQLDITAVAQKLHLSAATIQALEHGQLDQIQTVFLRGYIKKYARLLEINESELSLPVQDNALLPLRSAKYLYEREHEINSNHIIIQIVTWIIVLGLISLTWLWWQGQLEWEDTESNNDQDYDTSISETITSPTSSLSLSNTIPIHPNNSNTSVSETPPATISPTSPINTAPIIPLPNQPTSIPEPLQPSIPTLPVPTSVQPGQAIAGGIESGTTSATNATEIPAVTATTLTPPLTNNVPPPPQVVLKMLKTSKVEVTDATEKFKLTGKLRKGEEHIFDGKPPYKIVLEKASAVKLTIDGKLFKIKSTSSSGSTTFNLDPNN